MSVPGKKEEAKKEGEYVKLPSDDKKVSCCCCWPSFSHRGGHRPQVSKGDSRTSIAECPQSP